MRCDLGLGLQEHQKGIILREIVAEKLAIQDKRTVSIAPQDGQAVRAIS